MKSKTGERRGKTNVEQVEKRVPQDNNPKKSVPFFFFFTGNDLQRRLD
jgi:hypothetical protein